MRVKISEEEKNFITESAYLLKDLCRYDEAKNTFKGLISLYPENDLPYAGFSEVLISEGKIDEAKNFLIDALKKFPDSELLNFLLGETYLFSGDKEKAKEIFSKNIYRKLKESAEDYLKIIENLKKK